MEVIVVNVMRVGVPLRLRELGGGGLGSCGLDGRGSRSVGSDIRCSWLLSRRGTRTGFILRDTTREERVVTEPTQHNTTQHIRTSRLLFETIDFNNHRHTPSSPLHPSKPSQTQNTDHPPFLTQYAQELLQTFSTTLGEISLIPVTGGIFTITLFHVDKSTSDTNNNNETETETKQPGAVVQETLIWDRKTENGFPETKELKNRIRNVIDPQRDMGHIDRVLKRDQQNQSQTETETSSTTDQQSQQVQSEQQPQQDQQHSQQQQQGAHATGGESLSFGENVKNGASGGESLDFGSKVETKGAIVPNTGKAKEECEDCK